MQKIGSVDRPGMPQIQPACFPCTYMAVPSFFLILILDRIIKENFLD